MVPVINRVSNTTLRTPPPPPPPPRAKRLATPLCIVVDIYRVPLNGSQSFRTHLA